MATPATYDLDVPRNTPLNKSFVLRDSDGNPVDLTGYVIEMDVRETPDSTTEELTFTVGNGNLIVNPAAGEVTIQLDSTQTNSIGSVDWVYDIRYDPPGQLDAFIPIKGRFKISKTVTR